VEKQSRIKLPLELACLTRDEWVEIVQQARFSAIDREIIRQTLILGRTEIEAGVYVDRDRKTVCRHLKLIIKRAQEIKSKLNIVC
jgi:hypothetical protein